MGDRKIQNLKPSKLGTKEYWDQSYQKELDNGLGQDEEADLTRLESWFDEVDAPAKILEYLTDEHFPLSPNNPERTIDRPDVLDLGCGNGSSLFELKLEGNYQARLIGVDYSQQSIDLARRLWSKYVEQQASEDSGSPLHLNDIRFEKLDLMKDNPLEQVWWPKEGFDLVTDKGTFDAVTLSAETIDMDGQERRICELYPSKVIQMMRPGGYLLVTSVNWTEEELIRWFRDAEQIEGLVEVFGRVKYPTYEFGGRKGQVTASICFRKRVAPPFKHEEAGDLVGS